MHQYDKYVDNFTHLCRVAQKSKLLILSKYVNKTEKIGGTWTNTNSYRENEALSDIFTWNILLHYYLCLNVLWLKAVNEITSDYTTRPLHKHGVIKVCSIEYTRITLLWLKSIIAATPTKLHVQP